MALLHPYPYNQEVVLLTETTTTTITETTLGQIEISGVQVYVIRKEDENNTILTYITADLEQRIPIGIVVIVPGYNEPFIYFDEMEGPEIFEHFNENMFHQCLNWVDVNIGTQEEVEFLQDLFANIITQSHRILNEIIIEAQDRSYDNEEMIFLIDL
jgi:hypothetical protein